eukprot:6150827-Prymnesium_polylepis.1
MQVSQRVRGRQPICAKAETLDHGTERIVLVRCDRVHPVGSRCTARAVGLQCLLPCAALLQPVDEQQAIDVAVQLCPVEALDKRPNDGAGVPKRSADDDTRVRASAGTTISGHGQQQSSHSNADTAPKRHSHRLARLLGGHVVWVNGSYNIRTRHGGREQ